MAKIGGCAPGWVYDADKRACVPVSELPKHMLKEKCKKGWRFDNQSKSCVQIGEQPCKPGWLYDPKTETCVVANRENVVEKKELKNKCKDGWGYDSLSGSCVKEEECKPGHVFNPTLRACVTKVPDCKTGWAYDEDKGACVLMDAFEGQQCPVDSDFDPETGACMPRGKRKALSVIDMVPRPRRLACAWRYDPHEPFMISPDSKFVKSTYGDLIRSSYSNVLKECGVGGPFEFIISDGIKNIWVGPSKYKASHLYAVAEELYGKPYLNHMTGRPLPEVIGTELMLWVRYSYSYGDEGPLIVDGRNRVLYVIEPVKSDEKW